MGNIFRQLRFAARSLLRDKGFAVTAILTLAISIGASAAMFAIVNSVLLRPLPFPDSDAIVLMGNKYPKVGVGSTNYSAAGDYYDRLRGVTALMDQAMFNLSSQTIEIDNTAQQISGMSATPSLFRVLKAKAAVGRTFTDEEGELGGERKVVLSYGLWQQLFGGDPAVAGRELRMSGRQYAIVGVMPRGFVFIDPEVRL